MQKDFLLFQVLRDLENLGITFLHVMANRSTLKVNYNGINSLETWTQSKMAVVFWQLEWG